MIQNSNTNYFTWLHGKLKVERIGSMALKCKYSHLRLGLLDKGKGKKSALQPAKAKRPFSDALRFQVTIA